MPANDLREVDPPGPSANQLAPVPRYRQFVCSGHRIDAVIAAVLSLATFVVHDLSYILSTPFWVDEAWVAVSTKVPLRALPHVTSVSPLGWTLLLRTAVIGGEQRYRLIPLLFSALTVLMAYLFARNLPWSADWWARLAGAITAIAVLLAPSSLARNDLKQYTADAFATVSLLFLISRVERSWTRRALAVSAAACVVAFMISAVALFVAVAGFGALLVATLLRRQWRRACEAAAVGLGVGLGLGVLFLVLYKPHLPKNLTAYWQFYYLPVDKGLPASLSYLHRRGEQMAGYLGMGPLLVAIVLVLAGVVTLALSRRPALALVGPLLLFEMIALGAARKYPLFDERTSHFLTITFAVYAAVGVAGLASFLARRQAQVGLALALLATAAFAFNVRHDLRRATIPVEDVRTPTEYVAANRQPADVVLVSAPASEGFSYYWPTGRPAWHPSPAVATGFATSFPDQPEIIVAASRDGGAVQAALDRALAESGTRSGARIWLVRMHVNAAENRYWVAALQRRGVQPTRVNPTSCYLLVLAPAPSAGVARPVDAKAATC